MTGRRGEEEAYFHLRRQGYVMVARNFRSRRRRGEIDLIGWDGDVLCFVEVKTRTSHEVKPAEAAVDEDKRRELAGVARDYWRGAARGGDPARIRFRHCEHLLRKAATSADYPIQERLPRDVVWEKGLGPVELTELTATWRAGSFETYSGRERTLYFA